MNNGARLYTGDAVERIERGVTGWTAVTVRGSVSAQWVVMTTDVYAAEVGEFLSKDIEKTPVEPG